MWAAEDKKWTKKNAIQHAQSEADYDNRWRQNNNMGEDYNAGWMDEAPPNDDWVPNDGRSTLVKRDAMSEYFSPGEMNMF